MKAGISVLVSLMALSLTLLGLTSCGHNNEPQAAQAATAPQPQPQSKPDLQKQLQDADQQVRPDIEKQRAQAEQQANQTLDKEAIEAIDQTQNAIDAIAANKNSEALAAIEQATGKINILLARNPASALIPVAAEVVVIDTAPTDDKAVTQLGQNVSKAVADRDFPTARVLLYVLMSEIRVRTSNLPLASYPTALTEAARLLDQKQTTEAANTLLTALNTLVVVDQVTPLPLVLARAAIDAAKEQEQKDKDKAQVLLQTARKQLERSKELGYAGRDPEYAALDSDISNLEKQLKGNGDASSVFAKLENRVSAFLGKQQSERVRR
jgi:hypothetical protein